MDEGLQCGMGADETLEGGSAIKVSDRVWVKRLHSDGVVQEICWDGDGGVEYYLVRVGKGARALTLVVDPLDVGTWL